MSREWEGGLAVGGLVVGLVLGAAFVVVGAVQHSFECWGEAAFWCVAAGGTALYGFGCFRIWPGSKLAAAGGIWHGHQYWLNGLGAAVGWGAVRLMWWRRTDFSNGYDFLLGLIAFLGVTGFVPYTAAGIGAVLRDLIKKVGG
jgi:hypothetical protein